MTRALKQIGFVRALGATRLVLVMAAGAVSVVSLVVVLAAIFDVWWLAATGLCVLLSAVLLVQVDVWLRVHAPRRVLTEKQRRTPPSGSVSLQSADSSSAVLLMQSQYTGRLDRMQRSLDEALVRLRRDEPDQNTEPPAP